MKSLNTKIATRLLLFTLAFFLPVSLIFVATHPAVAGNNLPKVPEYSKTEVVGAHARTIQNIEGWNVLVDDRLLAEPFEGFGSKAIKFLEAKLFEITVIVPAEQLKQLQAVTIILDQECGGLASMQYHPSAGWLKANGYSRELARCVHLPRASDLPTARNISEQPFVILHELAHAYHDQVLGFDQPQIIAAYEQFKASGNGEKTMLHNGRRVEHYGLTNHKEFFAEMTEAFFGANDFYPFNRAELKESEPQTFELLKTIWK